MTTEEIVRAVKHRREQAMAEMTELIEREIRLALEAHQRGDPLPIGERSGIHCFLTKKESGFNEKAPIYGPELVAKMEDLKAVQMYADWLDSLTPELKAEYRRQVVEQFNAGTPKMSGEEMAEATARMREVLGLSAEPKPFFDDRGDIRYPLPPVSGSGPILCGLRDSADEPAAVEAFPGDPTVGVEFPGVWLLPGDPAGPPARKFVAADSEYLGREPAGPDEPAVVPAKEPS